MIVECTLHVLRIFERGYAIEDGVDGGLGMRLLGAGRDGIGSYVTFS